MQRIAADQPWKVMLTDGYSVANPNLSGIFDPAYTDQAGYIRSVEVGAAPEPAGLAQYWQAWKDTRRAPVGTPFANGLWTDQFARSAQGAVNVNGLRGRYAWSASPQDPTYLFTMASYAIECGDLREEKTWTAPGGGTARQDAARTNWGHDLRPGRYRAVVTVVVYQPCFLLEGPTVHVTGADEYYAGGFGVK